METAVNYRHLQPLFEQGYQVIYTKDINDSNIDEYFEDCIDILSDGIETPYVQGMKIQFIFTDGEAVTLSLMDSLFNFLMWPLITCTHREISSRYLYFEEAITKSSIKKYIDQNFIKPNIKYLDILTLNQTIDRAIGKFRDLANFQMYLGNSMNLKDTIDLMNQYPEFNDAIHLDISNTLLEDVKERGMQAINTQIQYIKKSDHCLRDAFIAGEAVNAKQYKEVAANIGTKPDGLGSVFPVPIQGSFINGGLKTVEEVVEESSVGRIAQILKKKNVGDSGSFARKLGLNNQDSFLHKDPEYICDSRNFQPVEIKNSDILDMFNMRYYRFYEDGPEYLLDSDKDRHLIGQTLYFRSPMTCASAARGEGICYRCYGDLAYVNRDINIGQMAAELLSAIYTQILLSAKHLLESAIVKLNWTPIFHKVFNVAFNLITLKEDMNYKGMKLIIDPDEIIDDESDDEDLDDPTGESSSGSYVTYVTVQLPDGTKEEVKTSDSDQLFLHQDLISYLEDADINEDSGLYELDMNKMKDVVLFNIDVRNNELSKTMNTIMHIIDNKAGTKSYNRKSILQAFIDNNLAGGIKLNSVHFEVLLMNQIRAKDDILRLPEWAHRNEDYQILTLREALKNNRSISIRLQANQGVKTLIHPDNRKISEPSIMDLYAMEKPQEYMSGQIPMSDYTLIDEQTKLRPAIYFFTSEEENLDNDTGEEVEDDE